MTLVLILITLHLYFDMRTYTIVTKSPVTIASYNGGFTILTEHICDTYRAIRTAVPELARKVNTIIDGIVVKLLVFPTVSISVETCATEDGLYTHIKLTY